MPILLFLSRVAFICNICYLLSFIFRARHFTHEIPFSSSIIVMGTVLALLMNVIVTVIVCTRIVRGNLYPGHQGWLFIINFLFFIILFIDLIT